METSIIIRTKNEEKWIGAVLEMLKKQTYQDFEIIIVDSGSSDMTLEIAKKYQVKIIEIPQEEFSFPHALNIGCKAAKAEKYFVILSAHSLPISELWLQDGINDFTDDKIFGVYGSMRALEDGSIWEKISLNYILKFIDHISPVSKIQTKMKLGVMGFTHAIIRRKFWDSMPLNEDYGLGGEDYAWSSYWYQKGFYAIKDRRFSVYHSHGLGIIGIVRQLLYWNSVVKKAQPFHKLSFRNWNW